MSEDMEDFQACAKKMNNMRTDISGRNEDSVNNEKTIIKVSEKWRGAQFLNHVVSQSSDSLSKSNDKEALQMSKRPKLEIEFMKEKSNISNEMTNGTITSTFNHNNTPIATTDLESDIELPGGIKIMILTESDYIGGISTYKRRLARFYKARSVSDSSIVLCVKSHLSAKDFTNVQVFCVIELGLALIPISDNIDVQLPQIINQLIHVTDPSKKRKNPFKFGASKTEITSKSNIKTNNTSSDAIETLCTIPGIGENKAKRLLERFANIASIAEASIKDLSETVGSTVASKVHEFLKL